MAALSRGMYIGNEDELTWGCGLKKLDLGVVPTASYGLEVEVKDEGEIIMDLTNDWDALWGSRRRDRGRSWSASAGASAGAGAAWRRNEGSIAVTMRL